MARFVHTADWQIGMTRHFLSDDAQARFTEARFDAVRQIGRIAKSEQCDFVVVCGDVFETNQVDRKTVARACEALGAIPMSVFLLPGNHDPLDAGSVFRSPTFLARKPPHVHVLDDTTPHEVRPGVEVLGAPWTSKRPLRDLVGTVAAASEPRPGVVRVLAGHGAVDTLSPDSSNPSVISLSMAERCLEESRVHYVALGDRHSLTQVGTTGRVWYAGTPVATDFDEVEPGFALVVDLTRDAVKATPHEIGSWRFRSETSDLNNDADLDALQRTLQDIDAKERTVLRVVLRGSLTLKQHARLQSVLDHARDVFAALDVLERKTDLVVVPEATDFADLRLSGFAQTTVERLRAQAMGTEDSATARDALALLIRLAGGRT